VTVTSHERRLDVAVGFIGLGRMGLPMCLNLLAAGYRVTVNDRRGELSTVPVARGAVWAGSPEEVAASVDVLITMLPGPAEVETVMGGPLGALAALRPGATWIDMTTGSPVLAEVMADQGGTHGVAVLDAPVGGGPPAAAAGTLQVFVRGDGVVLESCRELLGVLGDPDRIVHFGPSGFGCTAKLLVNLLWFGQALANAEALMLAHRAGIDLEVFRGAVAAGSVSSYFAQHDAPALLGGDYVPAFSFARCCEELRAVRDIEQRFALELPVVRTVERTYQRALDRYGDVDGELLAVKLLEDTNGILLRHPAHRPPLRPRM
jgi:3-hydroxyisobutyrate dehydrogenase